MHLVAHNVFFCPDRYRRRNGGDQDQRADVGQSGAQKLYGGEQPDAHRVQRRHHDAGRRHHFRHNDRHSQNESEDGNDDKHDAHRQIDDLLDLGDRFLFLFPFRLSAQRVFCGRPADGVGSKRYGCILQVAIAVFPDIERLFIDQFVDFIFCISDRVFKILVMLVIREIQNGRYKTARIGKSRLAFSHRLDNRIELR